MANVKVKVELLSDGVSQLMCSDGIRAAVNSAAQKVAGVAGQRYMAKGARVVGDRPIALVVPAGAKGALDEAAEKRLSKAVTACRS
ncbi:MAG: hypothetical protein IKF14_02120 [Atopobiaceae bacterium]|nr:hypothetical protein [Atopobiaceae bacterium]